MSDDVRCLLRLPRQWQLQVWRWVPFQPRSIGCMCRIHVWTKLYSWLEIHTLISEKGVALMYLCSRLVLTCTGLVCTWSIVWILFHLFQAEQEVRTWQMSPAKVSWAGKQMRERFCFPGKVTTSSCVSCHEFQCNSAMSMHQAWCAVTNWANLRHQPVVQAVLIASVHDTVALCTILHNLALCHI